MRTSKTDWVGGVLALVLGLAIFARAEQAVASAIPSQQVGQVAAGDVHSLRSASGNQQVSTALGGETEEDHWRCWYFYHYHYYPAVRYYCYYPRVV